MHSKEFLRMLDIEAALHDLGQCIFYESNHQTIMDRFAVVEAKFEILKEGLSDE